VLVAILLALTVWSAMIDNSACAISPSGSKLAAADFIAAFAFDNFLAADEAILALDAIEIAFALVPIADKADATFDTCL